MEVQQTVDAEQVAVVFAALGDRTRLSLLRYVLEEEHCVTQCTEHVGLTQGAVSKQLGALADAGLLTRRRVSRRMYYRVKEPTVLTRLIAQAQTLVAPAAHDRGATAWLTTRNAAGGCGRGSIVPS